MPSYKSEMEILDYSRHKEGAYNLFRTKGISKKSFELYFKYSVTTDVANG